MASIVKAPFVFPSYVGFNLKDKHSLGSGDGVLILSSSFSGIHKTFLVHKAERVHCLSDVEKGASVREDDKKKNNDDVAMEKLEALWDDGYGTQNMKDFLERAKDIIKPDGGPLRWFCPVECGRPLKNSPLLLYLPGMDGVGLGLVSHHKALGKVFEVQCLHIPVHDRTPFEGLVDFVESTVRLQHASAPDKPIYMVGDSFGGCIALAVAAHNPDIDLVLILINPATSFDSSPLRCLLPIAEFLASGHENTVPYALSFILGDPLKVAMVDMKSGSPAEQIFGLFFGNLINLLPSVYGLADNIPKDTFLWKVKLQKRGAAYANSRIHAVKAQVLVLASGKDSLFHSRLEAERLSSSTTNCKFRYFEDSEHRLLMEDGINLLTIIKATSMYRRSRKLDHVSDFLPLSMSEYDNICNGRFGIIRLATSPVMLSTMDDGKIVRSLAGVPNEGPVLLVGNHMLLGSEIGSVVQEFLREKNVMVHGMAHLHMFTPKFEDPSKKFSYFDLFGVFGAIPVTPRNFYKLLSMKSYVLLYPGGLREALHRKGEKYKLFWPEQPEFVRVAAKFGATIVPFGAVGEDDIVELFLDYNDLMRIPFVNDHIRDTNRDAKKLRTGKGGQVSEEDFFNPVFYPKIPGRFYLLFGKPFETKGKEEMLKEEEYRKSFYLQIKSEVERAIAYLIKKREEDPYRGILQRTLYRAFSAPTDHVPSFEP